MITPLLNVWGVEVSLDALVSMAIWAALAIGGLAALYFDEKEGAK